MELIYRPIINKIKTQIDKGNVIILIGARQVGKTFKALMSAKKGTDEYFLLKNANLDATI